MPAYIVAIYLAKAITTIWGMRIKLMRVFQKYMSEMSMGRFIGHYGRTESVKIYQEELMSALIKAYLHIMTMPCILSSFGDEIRSQPYLHEFFSQFKGYEQWVQWRLERQELPQERPKDHIFYKAMIETTPYPHLYGRIGEQSESPKLLMQDIIESLNDTWDLMTSNPTDIVNYINQHWKDSDFDIERTYAPKWFWYLIHPTMDMDWTIIKSHIILLQTYRDIRLVHETIDKVPPFFQRQMAKVLTESVLAGEDRLDHEGKVTFQFPAWKAGDKIILDTYGLTKEVSIQPICTYSEILPEQVILAPIDNWDLVKPYIEDNVKLIMRERAPASLNETIKQAANEKALTFYLAKDTAAYHNAQCPAWFDLMYVEHTYTDGDYIDTVIDLECLKDYTGWDSLPHYADWAFNPAYHVATAKRYAHCPRSKEAQFCYNKYGKSWIVEAPQEGLWLTDEDFSEWVKWLPTKRVIWLTGEITYIIHPHPRRYLSEFLASWCSTNNVEFLDLR